jgi:hypothetical protein
MSKLIFRIKGDDTKWDEYLNGFLGEDIAKECIVEGVATASDRTARVHILNFKNDKNVINKLKGSNNVISAFLVDNNEVKQKIV